MATLPITFVPPTPRVVFAATAATKGAGAGGSKEKGIFDWILGGLQKEDQFYETDPILKKVEDKNGGGGGNGNSTPRKNPVSVPQKKKGGFGGLFAKK